MRLRLYQVFGRFTTNMVRAMGVEKGSAEILAPSPCPNLIPSNQNSFAAGIMF